MLLQTSVFMDLVTSYSKRRRLDMGYVYPWRVLLTPATHTLSECKCPTAAVTPIICSQHSSMWGAGCSAPARLHIPAVWKEDSGTCPHLHRETSLPLQPYFRSHNYSGGNIWMQGREPACLSPVKDRIAGWMSQLSAPLRKVSYSSEGDQLS